MARLRSRDRGRPRGRGTGSVVHRWESAAWASRAWCHEFLKLGRCARTGWSSRTGPDILRPRHLPIFRVIPCCCAESLRDRRPRRPHAVPPQGRRSRAAPRPARSRRCCPRSSRCSAFRVDDSRVGTGARSGAPLADVGRAAGTSCAPERKRNQLPRGVQGRDASMPKAEALLDGLVESLTRAAR